MSEIKKLDIGEISPAVAEKSKSKEGTVTTIKFQESARPFDESKAAVPVNEKLEAKRKLAEVEEEEKKMVRGIFRYHECPKGSVAFPFKKYKGDKIKNYAMADGKIYTIPLAVARHLNTNPWYPVQSYDPKDSSVTVSEKVFRMSFQNVEF